MAEGVKLKVEFDDSAATNGFNRLNGKADAFNRGKGGTSGGGSGDDSKIADSIGKSVGAVLITQLGQQITPVLVSALDPRKTARQKEEASIRAGAEITGAVVGAAIGSALPGIGTIVGAAVGSQIGKLAGEIATMIDPKGKAVNESISNTLQQEAATRARLGLPIDSNELRRIGSAEKAGATAEFEARQRAIGITNELSPSWSTTILMNLGLIRGRRADSGGFAFRDAASQMTDDR
jgi:hypothetical protein